ncbi:hypothetical protein [Shewanella acanthi]|uniref:hypothetical protein n=1 Tax=Shewanella acanthi TaxID=2864212 RepID=UPI0021AC156D|nr:hypothetical protein [Shewanella acanthi]
MTQSTCSQAASFTQDISLERGAISLAKSTVATLQLGVAKADGKLTLTEDILSFVPFNHRLGLGPYCLALDEILSVEPCSGKAGGIIPITYNAIRINLSNQQSYEFILADTHKWLETLNCVIGDS